jgi:DNA-binding beta-propeller fold protein YncE
LTFPWLIALDETYNRIYVTDFISESAVKVFDLNGNYITSYGTQEQTLNYGTSNLGTFYLASGIAVHPITHDLYIGDYLNYRVQVADSSGNFKTAFGEKCDDFENPTLGCIISPVDDIEISPVAPYDIYVADFTLLEFMHNVKILKYNSNHIFLTEWYGTALPINAENYLNNPCGLSIDINSNVYVPIIPMNKLNPANAVYQAPYIQKFDKNLNELSDFTVWTDSSRIIRDSHIDINCNRLYVTDTHNPLLEGDNGYRAIKIFNATTHALISTIVLPYGTGYGKVEFLNGITVDANGNIYFVDSSNGKVLKYKPVQ